MGSSSLVARQAKDRYVSTRTEMVVLVVVVVVVMRGVEPESCGKDHDEWT